MAKFTSRVRKRMSRRGQYLLFTALVIADTVGAPPVAPPRRLFHHSVDFMRYLNARIQYGLIAYPILFAGCDSTISKPFSKTHRVCNSLPQVAPMPSSPSSSSTPSCAVSTLNRSGYSAVGLAQCSWLRWHVFNETSRALFF